MVNCIGVRTDGYVNKHIFIIHCILVFTTGVCHRLHVFPSQIQTTSGGKVGNGPKNCRHTVYEVHTCLFVCVRIQLLYHLPCQMLEKEACSIFCEEIFPDSIFFFSITGLWSHGE